MPRMCEYTGIKTLVGNNVSHSHQKTKKRQNPNLKKKKYLIHELGGAVTLTLSTRAIRTIDKFGGIGPALLKAKEGTLSPRLLRLRHQMLRINRPKAKKAS